MITPLITVDQVIEKLGGLHAVDELTAALSKKKSKSRVGMWKHRRKFPPQTYTTLQTALRKKGFSAPNTLWGMP